ncbi:hypothetical protein RAS2_13940 [Phycisphaerae bacterium RAS2]|nr:hypothetical protein RAS2_13940 [Phycisphaerae bacterium RAS2]
MRPARFARFDRPFVSDRLTLVACVGVYLCTLLPFGPGPGLGLTGLLGPQAALGQIIVLGRQPLNTGGGAADTAFINDSGQPYWQQVADDVMVPASAIVDRIVWWGFYGGNFTSPAQQPPANETMRVRFYDSRPTDGLPGVVLFEQSFVNPMRVPTGRQVLIGAHPDEQRYEVDLSQPFQLEANAPYWLEIVQVGDINSYFRWEFAPTGGLPLAFTNLITGGWTSTGNSLWNNAFQLITIPEPSTALLSLAGIGTAVSRRRKSKRLGGKEAQTCLWENSRMHRSS